jgi:hypothetical protein
MPNLALSAGIAPVHYYPFPGVSLHYARLRLSLSLDELTHRFGLLNSPESGFSLK